MADLTPKQRTDLEVLDALEARLERDANDLVGYALQDAFTPLLDNWRAAIRDGTDLEDVFSDLGDARARLMSLESDLRQFAVTSRRRVDRGMAPSARMAGRL